MERLFKPVPGTDARQMDFVPSKEPHECVARLPVPVCRGETWWIGRELRRPLCVAGDGCIKCCSRQSGTLVVFSETRNEIRSAGRILSGAIKRQVFDSILLLFLSTLEDG